MKDWMLELIWTLFWLGMAILGIVLAWHWLLIFIFFLLAGFIYIGDEIF